VVISSGKMTRLFQRSFYGSIQVDTLPVGQKQNVLFIEENDLDAGVLQLTIPGEKVIDLSPDRIRQHAHNEMREETSSRVGKFEKLLYFCSYPGYVAHKVHLLVADDLEWDQMEIEDGEEIRVHAFMLAEALKATRIDFRCDPEAALADAIPNCV
jgi:hypothetical protein